MTTKAERVAQERKAAARRRERERRRTKRLNQRERARNLSKYPVVARMPGPPRATAGQQSGIPMSPGPGYPSRWVREAFARQARERARQAAAEASRP